jgi:hypothetical protein
LLGLRSEADVRVYGGSQISGFAGGAQVVLDRS